MESQFKPRQYVAGRDAPSASYENARTQELLRLGKMSGDGIVIHSDSSGVSLSVPRGLKLVFAEITGATGTAHSWKEVEPANDGTGEFMDVANGLTGDASVTPKINPAYTFSGGTIATGEVVALLKSVGRPESGAIVQEWLIVGSGGGGGEGVVRVTGAAKDGDGYQDGVIAPNQSGAGDTIKVYNYLTAQAALPSGATAFYHAVRLTSAPAGSPTVPVYGLAYTVCA